MFEKELKPIETRFDGRRFRSRTEARWAVFFKEMGWRYEYEREGVVLDGEPYLPDFFLPEFPMWIEVKGTAPNEREDRLARALAEKSGVRVLIAAGPPSREAPEFIVYEPGEKPVPNSVIRQDRRNEGEYWICSRETAYGYGDSRSIGPIVGPPHDRAPMMLERMRGAYIAAQSARFEFGESG